TGKRASNGPSQLENPWGQLQGISTLEMQAMLTNRKKLVRRYSTFCLFRHGIKFPLELGTEVGRCLGKFEIQVGIRTFLFPAVRIVDQMAEGDMTTTLREIHIPGAQAIPQRHRESQFPGSPIKSS